MFRALFRQAPKWPIGILVGAMATIASGIRLVPNTSNFVSITGWIIFGIGCVLVVLFFIWLFFWVTDFLQKRRRSVVIREDWVFYYWPRLNRISITVLLDIVSEADTAKCVCTAQVDKHIIHAKFKGRFDAGSIPYRRIAEFTLDEVEIPEEIDKAVVSFTIKLSDGVKREATKEVKIQRVG